MMQSVNLYTQEFQPVKVSLPLSQIVLMAVVLIVGLIAISFVLQSFARESAVILKQEQAQLESIQTQEEALQKQLEAQKLDESLVRHNERLQDQIQARKTLLSTLDSAVIEEFSGFSPYLIGFARQIPETLWLSKIHVAQHGSELQIEGVTTQTESVPNYLDVLKQEAVFVGQSFSVFDLMSKDDTEGEWGFKLQSENTGASPVLITSSAPSFQIEGSSIQATSESEVNE